MTTAQDGGKVVNIKHRPSLHPENAPGTHFCQKLSRPQGHSAIGRILCQWKIPMTPAGIEPANFGFLAQHTKPSTFPEIPVYERVFKGTTAHFGGCMKHPVTMEI